MKSRRLLLWVVLLMLVVLNLGASVAQGQDINYAAFAAERVKASSIVWRGHRGYRKEEPDTVYVLLTAGGFHIRPYINVEKVIKTWLVAHPNADAVLISHDGLRRNNRDIKVRCVWIVDGEDNFNIEVIRMGCPSDLMLPTEGYRISPTRAEYQAFYKQAKEADRIAQRQRLGYWKYQRF